MLETNKALIRKWIDAWIVNDLVVLDEIFAQDYRVNETRIGVEGVKQAVQFLHSVFSDISAELHEMIAEEDKVVIRWTIRGRHTGNFMGVLPTGKELELTGINIYQIVDHKIIANREQTNISEVIQKLKANPEADVP
ncbi:MAG TPA: ester cyclase [Anaerolineales bacterium]|nr:ester cyclase [Anaerolineales bacterium]